MKLHRKPDLTVFSKPELSLIETVCKELGRKSAGVLSELGHKEPAWHYAGMLDKLLPHRAASAEAQSTLRRVYSPLSRLRKMRLQVPGLNVGKSGSYRLIYRAKEMDEAVPVMFLETYFKADTEISLMMNTRRCPPPPTPFFPNQCPTTGIDRSERNLPETCLGVHHAQPGALWL